MELLEKQIKMLEALIVGSSETAYLLDKDGNFELSKDFHQNCVEVIDRLFRLRKSRPIPPISFVPYSDEYLG